MRRDGGTGRGGRERLVRLLPPLFAAVLAVDLIALLAGSGVGHAVAKPLLMPLLAGYAALRGAPRTLVAALLFGWGGDVFLLLDAEWAFLVGMGSFAAGHVCYLLLFGRARTSPLLGAGYGVALVAVVLLLWPDLPAPLRIPVAGYSLLLAAMAYRALFLFSDTLIATGVADWPQAPVPDFWIMLTYGAAQYLLATGVLTSSSAGRPLPTGPAAAPSPGVRPRS
ncbi:hypothetical protein ATE80_19725 [Streptomyces kanasensis]|uniref:Lysoplasmalogenase n=1 Tax=Streptomyces kanasensis TaxID=936756 RepID=A0A100Y3S9_9ACTN|nr:hypothetical protein ATE80_19725 [Streptomyces kanasensis]